MGFILCVTDALQQMILLIGWAFGDGDPAPFAMFVTSSYRFSVHNYVKQPHVLSHTDTFTLQ